MGYTYTTCKPFLFGRAPFSYSARLTDRLREDLMEYCGVSPRHCRIKGSQICQVSEGSIEDNVEPKLNRRPLSRRVDQLFPRDRRGLSCHLPACACLPASKCFGTLARLGVLRMLLCWQLQKCAQAVSRVPRISCRGTWCACF